MFYVDTVVYIDSLKHIILVDDPEDFVCKDNNTIQFIEGVGCSNLFGLIPVGDFSELLCCHKDGELVYHSNWNSAHVEGCLYRAPWDNIVNREKIKAVTVSPNPCSDWIRIDGENIDRATLLDIKGKIVMPNITLNEPVNLVNIPSGIYFLRVAHKDNISTKTIIKK
jgi:hypothetical protein